MADEIPDKMPEEGPDGEFIQSILAGQAEGDQITAAIRENAEEAEKVSTELSQQMLQAAVFLRGLGVEYPDIVSFFSNLGYRVIEMQKAMEVLGGGGKQ